MAKSERSERDQAVRRVLLGILVLNLAVAGVKLVFGVVSRSIAVEADAAHSAFDGLANVVGLLALRYAGAPPDREHPYGHHRFELLGALGIAFLIAATAGGIAVAAISRFGEPSRAHIDLPGLVLLGALALVSLAVSRYERRRGKELSSSVLAADAAHTMTDFFGTLVVLAAAAGIALGVTWLDGVAALLVAGLIAVAALRIGRESLDVFLEAAAVPRDAVEAAALSVEGVRSCHKIRSRGGEGAIFVDLHIQVDPAESVRTAHDRSGAVKGAIKAALPGVIDVLVHIEPDEP